MSTLPPIKKCSFVEGEPNVDDEYRWDRNSKGKHFVFYRVEVSDEEFEVLGPWCRTARGCITAWNRKVK